MNTKQFWMDAGERAVKAFAQTLLALLAAGATGLVGVDWLHVLDVSGLAVVASLLTSLVGSTVADPTSASVLPPATPKAPTAANSRADT